MVFYPKIQALIGDHTNNAGHSVQSAVDWHSGVQWQHSTPDGIDGYLVQMSINTGTELNYLNTSTAYPDSFDLYPVGFDANHVYINASLGGAGGTGIYQIDPITLALEQIGNTGVTFSDGTMSPIIAADDSTWMLVTGIGFQVFFEYFSCIKTSTTPMVAWGPGPISFSNRIAVSCTGPKGTGLGYVLSSGNAPASALIFEVNVNAAGSHSTIATIAPTDIDAGWTSISQDGMCLDQTDGNLIAFFEGQSGATNRYYICKVVVADGSIAWKTTIANVGGGPQVAQSQIKSQQYCHFSQLGAGLSQVETINTADGSKTISSFGLGGVGGGTISQCYNDQSGAIIGEFFLVPGAGSPVLLNATPSTFGGWAALYVVEPTNPVLSENSRATQLRIWGNWH